MESKIESQHGRTMVLCVLMLTGRCAARTPPQSPFHVRLHGPGVSHNNGNNSEVASHHRAKVCLLSLSPSSSSPSKGRMLTEQMLIGSYLSHIGCSRYFGIRRSEGADTSRVSARAKDSSAISKVSTRRLEIIDGISRHLSPTTQPPRPSTATSAPVSLYHD